MKKIILILFFASIFLVSTLFAGKIYNEDETVYGKIKSSYLQSQPTDPNLYTIYNST